MRNETEARMELLAVYQRMVDTGLCQGKSGNVSLRYNDGMLISPSGAAPENMQASDLVYVPFAPIETETTASEPGTSMAERLPSSEWRFHQALLLDRPEFNCILHSHSPNATALAVHGKGMPAFHYMVAIAGGADIRCAPYALFGSEALSEFVLAAMSNRKACLLAHHGLIAAGENTSSALAIMREVEFLAGIYLKACQLGEPPTLSEQEMRAVIAKFKHYGTNTA